MPYGTWTGYIPMRKRMDRKKRNEKLKMPSRQFEILPVSEPTMSKHFVGLDPMLPQPLSGAFRTMITGPSGSGKTWTMISLLKAYQPFFPSYRIFSPNLGQYERNLRQRDSDVYFSTISEAMLQREYAVHVRLNRRTRSVNYAVFVIDDFISQIGTSRAFREILYNSRKEGVSIVFTAQKYTLADLKIRQNLTNMLLFRSSRTELDKVADDMGLDRREVKQAYDSTVNQYPYSFLHCVYLPSARIFFNLSNTMLVPRDGFVAPVPKIRKRRPTRSKSRKPSAARKAKLKKKKKRKKRKRK